VSRCKLPGANRKRLLKSAAFPVLCLSITSFFFFRFLPGCRYRYKIFPSRPLFLRLIDLQSTMSSLTSLVSGFLCPAKPSTPPLENQGHHRLSTTDFSYRLDREEGNWIRVPGEQRLIPLPPNTQFIARIPGRKLVVKMPGGEIREFWVQK
ncbi:hypothetical protein NEOLI_000881, partial [Neolecta irregularis DAH-3]